MQNNAELVQTIEHLQSTFEELCVRGLRAAGSEQIKRLSAIHDELDRIGAAHLASQVAAVLAGIKSGDRAAAAALMRAQASLRVFERIVTMETASEHLALLSSGDSEDEE